mmetsp:Transcript_28885/g.57671  ORF Transcript_28885/g.57671 Transcript_28885/m.57671 type:complete len:220 (-) Transcript_28885:1345-2004(-)
MDTIHPRNRTPSPPQKTRCLHTLFHSKTPRGIHALVARLSNIATRNRGPSTCHRGADSIRRTEGWIESQGRFHRSKRRCQIVGRERRSDHLDFDAVVSRRRTIVVVYVYVQILTKIYALLHCDRPPTHPTICLSRRGHSLPIRQTRWLGPDVGRSVFCLWDIWHGEAWQYHDCTRGRCTRCGTVGEAQALFEIDAGVESGGSRDGRTATCQCQCEWCGV